MRLHYDKSQRREMSPADPRRSPVDSSVTSSERCFESTEERLRSFAFEIDALRRDVESQIGCDDIAYFERICHVSRSAEIVGRTLIHFSLDPITFTVGVGCLWVHKTLELMEVGHTVLHGTFDKVEGAERFHSRTFRWKAPIHERSWMMEHNVRHHQYTNIAGRDPDMDFGGIRLSKRIRHRTVHRLQPVSNLATWFAFATAINLHASGVLDVYLSKRQPAVLPDRSWASIRSAHAAFLSKFVPYYAREYLLFPALAGPFFWKVAIGNAISEMARDVWAAAIIYCGHVGARDFAEGHRAGSRAAWYAMQVETACDIETSPIVSILCGALDKQIEHHLFPRVPPNRLREIVPRVQAICEEHGVRYRSARWHGRLREVLGVLRRLARPAPVFES